MADYKDLPVTQGETFAFVIQWETETQVYVPVASMTPTAPLRITTSVPHGMPDGWKGAVTNAKGLTEINAEANAVKDKDRHACTLISPTEITINSVNAAGFKPHTAGTGIIEYYAPQDLTGYTARCTIKAKTGVSLLLRCKTAGTSGNKTPIAAGADGTAVWEATMQPATKEWQAATAFGIGDVIDGTAIMFLSTANSRIVIDQTKKTITLTLSATETAALTWKAGVYELELVSPTGVVTKLYTGKFLVSKEVTT